MTDLPPDVRDRAIFEAREVLFSWIEGRSIDPELAPAIVVAVVAVVAPEIERPLQARIAELEETLADNRKLWDESIAQTGAALDQSRQIYAEFVTGQHEEALARVEELESEVAARKRSGEALNTECEQIGEKADEAWRALSPYMARVELLAAALKKVTDYFASAPALMSTGQWEALSDARAALAAGETESEAP